MSGAALPSLPDPDRVLFASDMHLDDRHPALVERFLTELAARLQATPASGSTLFLLGDLFEYWISTMPWGRPHSGWQHCCTASPVRAARFS